MAYIDIVDYVLFKLCIMTLKLNHKHQFIWVLLSKGENDILIRNFRTLKNKYDFTLCQSIYTLPLKRSSVIKQFRSGSIFCIFASIACILIGKDEEYEKIKNARENFRLSVQCSLV